MNTDPMDMLREIHERKTRCCDDDVGHDTGSWIRDDSEDFDDII